MLCEEFIVEKGKLKPDYEKRDKKTHKVRPEAVHNSKGCRFPEWGVHH